MSRTEPMRVLWLIKGLGLGGAEQLLALSAPYLDRDRFRVEVAYVLPYKSAHVDTLRASGLPVHCLGAGKHGRAAWPGRLRTLTRQRRFDLVHTHSPVPAVAARLLLRPGGPVLIHTEHNVWDRYRFPTYALNALTYRRNAAALAVSAGVAESVRRPPWAPWLRVASPQVLHHGIDQGHVHRGPEARRRARRRLGLGDAELVVGSVGNFTPKKDQRRLIDALEILLADHPGIRLVLVGSGPLEAQLRAHRDSRRLTRQIHFTGSRDDVPELLPAFDVFALSSVHEGLPIAVVEALAAGLPCVATRVGGVEEVITDGREGFIVPPRDLPALAAALDKLLSDADLRHSMGAQGPAAAANFSIEATVRRLEVIYQRAVSRP